MSEHETMTLVGPVHYEGAATRQWLAAARKVRPELEAGSHIRLRGRAYLDVNGQTHVVADEVEVRTDDS